MKLSNGFLNGLGGHERREPDLIGRVFHLATWIAIFAGALAVIRVWRRRNPAPA